MPSPSLKKLGKRPEINEMDIDMPDATATTLLSRSPGITTTAHQKRVLPSRSRRGGPGVGNCSVDLLIMDTEKRTRDAKPVIPPTQSFFLTTHSRAVPPPPEGGASDGEAVGSYFDKPEVKAAYLAQRAIQVPEFLTLPDDAVGGRLRARAEEEGPDTSDAAYLLRHRKYETFEKRQRRREKEKLVHEQYKLKERIEQLKGMDASAFGGGGEARRKEMLDVAEGLEMRYAVLLPPEPRRAPKKNENKRRKSDAAPTATPTGDDVDVEMEGEVVVGLEKEKEAPPSAPTGPRLSKVNKQNVRVEPQTPVPSRPLAVSVALPSSVPPRSYIAPEPSATPSSRTSARVRDASGRFLILSKQEGAPTPEPPQFTPEAVNVARGASGAPPPRKRPRVDSQIKRPQTPEFNPISTSVLLQIAARKAAQPQARQTSRTTLAFGFRVPPEVEEPLFFALPEWLATQEELEHLHEVRARSATRSASPNPVGYIPNGVEIAKDVTMEPDSAVTLPTLVNGDAAVHASQEGETREAALPKPLPPNEETEKALLNPS